MLLVLGLVKCLLCQLILMSEVIDVPLESVYLLDARLLPLFDLPHPQLRPVQLLLKRLQLYVALFGLLSELCERLGESLIFQTGLPVISQNVVLFKL